MMRDPLKTAEVFDVLSKGQFICANSCDAHVRRLYDTVEEHFDALREYFLKINFMLESGDEYFYFSRQDARSDLERKVESAYRWIDLIDFFKAYDVSFGPGYRFSAAEI